MASSYHIKALCGFDTFFFPSLYPEACKHFMSVYEAKTFLLVLTVLYTQPSPPMARSRLSSLCIVPVVRVSSDTLSTALGEDRCQH